MIDTERDAVLRPPWHARTTAARGAIDARDPPPVVERRAGARAPVPATEPRGGWILFGGENKLQCSLGHDLPDTAAEALQFRSGTVRCERCGAAMWVLFVAFMQVALVADIKAKEVAHINALPGPLDVLEYLGHPVRRRSRVRARAAREGVESEKGMGRAFALIAAKARQVEIQNNAAAAAARQRQGSEKGMALAHA